MMTDIENILHHIMNACIKISGHISNDNVMDLAQATNDTNISGDIVKKLDISSNNIFVKEVSKCDSVRHVFSEETNTIVEVNKNGKYLVTVDPLDGSSNIICNITVGTIFGIYKYDDNDVLKSGRNIVMSGYCLYSMATQLVIAYGDKLSIYFMKSNNND